MDEPLMEQQTLSKRDFYQIPFIEAYYIQSETWYTYTICDCV
jgi:hypothetical protein